MGVNHAWHDQQTICVDYLSNLGEVGANCDDESITNRHVGHGLTIRTDDNSTFNGLFHAYPFSPCQYDKI